MAEMDDGNLWAERDAPAHLVRRIAMEAAARVLFWDEAGSTAISVAVAQYVWDLRAARECRGTLVEVESTWIPAGKEQMVQRASEAFLDAVERRLRDCIAEDDGQ
ncbi:hypothetical protein D3C81_717160 [compost metagenome]